MEFTERCQAVFSLGEADASGQQLALDLIEEVPRKQRLVQLLIGCQVGVSWRTVDRTNG